MKRICFFCLAISTSLNVLAQLFVATDGNVGIGDNAVQTAGLLIKDKDYLYGLNIKNSPVGISVYNNCNNSILETEKWGMRVVNNLNNNIDTYGIKINTDGGGYYNSVNYGIYSYGGNSNTMSCGVFGGLIGSHVQNGTGVFGSSNNFSSISSQYAGVYAGYFSGDVRVTGTMYANVLTPSVSSSPTTSVNDNSIQVVSRQSDAEQKSVSDRLSNVNLLRINNITQLERFTGNNAEYGNTKNEESHDLVQVNAVHSEEEQCRMEIEISKRTAEGTVPQTQMASVRYELAADQLKEVFPELVYEDANGNVSINYIEMVPLLVQSLNEQQQIISDLKEDIMVLNEEIAELKGYNTQAVPSRKRFHIADTSVAATDIISLGQNSPNPFSENTSIEVNIPESVRTAALFIYDMSGKQVEKIAIADRGKLSISVSATGLHEGMYLYSLIADGKVIDTRKMILTK